MKLSIAKDDGPCVDVSVMGPITRRELGPHSEPLIELLGPLVYARQVRLDLSETNDVDASGIGWLLTCHKRMHEAGGKLTLHAPHPVVAKTLRILKLDKIIEIDPVRGSAPFQAGGAA